MYGALGKVKVRTGTKSRNDWNESITQVGLELVRLTPRPEGKEGAGHAVRSEWLWMAAHEERPRESGSS